MACGVVSHLGPCSSSSLQVFDFYSGTWRCYGKSSLGTVEAMLQIAWQRMGFWYDMVSFFKRIDLLDQMGGRDNVLNWTAPQARHWFPIFRERCNNIAEQDMLRTLRSGKYNFLAHAISTFESPRPTALSLGLLLRPLAEQFLVVLSLVGSRDWQVYPATTRTTVLSSMQTVFGA